MITSIDLLRHGEVSGGDYFRGSTNDPLTETGWQQMHKALDGHGPWDAVVSSPLRRCLEFANALCAVQETTAHIESDFQELHFGDWEGKTAATIQQQDAQALQRFYSDPLTYPPANSENLAVFQQRVTAAWTTIKSQNQGEKILLITHGGVIRSLLALTLGIPLKNTFRIQVSHASLTRIRCFKTKQDDFNQLVFHQG